MVVLIILDIFFIIYSYIACIKNGTFVVNVPLQGNIKLKFALQGVKLLLAFNVIYHYCD